MLSVLKGGGHKEVGGSLVSKACCDRTTGNGFKLKEGIFKLDVKKKFFFTIRVVKQWHRLPREVVGASFLKTFKVRLKGPLSNLI